MQAYRSFMRAIQQAIGQASRVRTRGFVAGVVTRPCEKRAAPRTATNCLDADMNPKYSPSSTSLRLPADNQGRTPHRPSEQKFSVTKKKPLARRHRYGILMHLNCPWSWLTCVQSACKMTSANRALQVYDICVEVVKYACFLYPATDNASAMSFTDWDFGANDRTLARLARTNRTFCEPSLDALWSELHTLNHLLKILQSSYEERAIVGRPDKPCVCTKASYPTCCVTC